MTRQEAKAIVDELSVKKNLLKLERDKLVAALKVLSNKWSLPS